MAQYISDMLTAHEISFFVCASGGSGVGLNGEMAKSNLGGGRGGQFGEIGM